MSARTKELSEDGRLPSHLLLVIHCHGVSSDGGSVPGVEQCLLRVLVVVDHSLVVQFHKVFHKILYQPVV